MILNTCQRINVLIELHAPQRRDAPRRVGVVGSVGWRLSFHQIMYWGKQWIANLLTAWNSYLFICIFTNDVLCISVGAASCGGAFMSFVIVCLCAVCSAASVQLIEVLRSCFCGWHICHWTLFWLVYGQQQTRHVGHICELVKTLPTLYRIYWNVCNCHYDN